MYFALVLTGFLSIACFLIAFYSIVSTWGRSDILPTLGIITASQFLLIGIIFGIVSYLIFGNIK